MCSDEDAQDLLRESQISLLQLSTMEVAAQLSMRDFELFRNIESTEYVLVKHFASSLHVKERNLIPCLRVKTLIKKVKNNTTGGILNEPVVVHG